MKLPARTPLYFCERMSATTQSLSAAAHRRPLVFIVDDEADAAEIIAELLQTEGYLTRIFNDPRVVVEELRKAPVKPDVLLADFKMPGFNGMQLIARCKSMVRGLKTVLVSGVASENAVHGYDILPDQHVTKPFPVTTLLRSVRQALDVIA